MFWKHTPRSHAKGFCSSSFHLQNREEHLPLVFAYDCLCGFIPNICAGVRVERISHLPPKVRISQAVFYTVLNDHCVFHAVMGVFLVCTANTVSGLFAI